MYHCEHANRSEPQIGLLTNPYLFFFIPWEWNASMRDRYKRGEMERQWQTTSWSRFRDELEEIFTHFCWLDFFRTVFYFCLWTIALLIRQKWKEKYISLKLCVFLFFALFLLFDLKNKFFFLKLFVLSFTLW